MPPAASTIAAVRKYILMVVPLSRFSVSRRAAFLLKVLRELDPLQKWINSVIVIDILDPLLCTVAMMQSLIPGV